MVGIFLYYLYCIACRLLSRRHNRISFISFPDASDNSWHLYRFLMGDLARTEFVWLVQDTACEEKIKSFGNVAGNKVTVVKRWSVKGGYYFLTSRIVFYTHGTYFFVGPSPYAPVLVNLWHGMPIKNIGFMDGKDVSNVAHSDYLLATSDFYRDIMANSFGISRKKVLVCGLPRNDVFLKQVESRDVIFERMKIPIANKIIVWLPTYRVSVVGDIRKDSTSNGFLDELADGFLGNLNALACLNNFNVIIKLHPMDSLNTSSHDAGLENIVFLNALEWKEMGVDLYDLLSVSDALVSDVSSVIIDYLSSGNSIGVIAKALDSYKRSTTFDLDELRVLVTQISTPGDFVGLLNGRAVSPVVMERRRNLNSKERGSEEACLSISRFFCADLRVDSNVHW